MRKSNSKSNEQKILDLLNDIKDYETVYNLKRMSGIENMHSIFYSLRKKGYVIDVKITETGKKGAPEKSYKLLNEGKDMKKNHKEHNGNCAKVLNCMLNSDWMTVNDIRLKSNASTNNGVHSAIANLRKKGYIIDSKPSGQFVTIGGTKMETKMYRITKLPTLPTNYEKKVDTSNSWTFNSLSEVPANVIVAGRKCRISLSFEE